MKIESIKDLWCYQCKQHFEEGELTCVDVIETTSSVEIVTYHLRCSPKELLT